MAASCSTLAGALALAVELALARAVAVELTLAGALAGALTLARALAVEPAGGWFAWQLARSRLEWKHTRFLEHLLEP